MHYLAITVHRDYIHYVHSTTGFSTEVDKQLMEAAKEAAKIAKAVEWEKCVVFVIDKMHVQEDLVYDKVLWSTDCIC